MTPYKCALWVMFLCGSLTPSFQINWVPLISKASGIQDVATFAISAVEFISGKSSKKDALLTDIQKSITNSKTEILESILLQSRFDKIDDAVISIHSSLVGFEAYLSASSNELETLKQQYVNRFDDNSVISHIRFLPELLTYSIPGTTGETLMSLFAKNAACNQTKITNFKTFYLHVISDGVALEVIYSEFKKIDPSKSVDHWAEKMVKITGIFQQEVDKCWYNVKYVEKCDAEIQLSKLAFGFIIVGSVFSPSILYCLFMGLKKCLDDEK